MNGTDDPRLIAAYVQGKNAYRCHGGEPSGMGRAELDAWRRGWRVARLMDRAQRLATQALARERAETAETAGAA